MTPQPRARRVAAETAGVRPGPLVFTCDDAFAMPVATALRSLAESNRAAWPLEIWILTHRFAEPARKNVEDSLPPGSASIRWRFVPLDRFADLAPFYGTRMNYVRLLIPELLPDASRALYLDADLLVLDDLAPLWEIDLEGAPLGAVVDEGIDPKLQRGDPEVRGVPRVASYFCDGVLLMDLDLWRRERITEQVLDWLRAHPGAAFAEQDALNAVCDGRWKMLDPRWDFQAHRDTEIGGLPPERRPAVAHFVTHLKPWNPAALNVNAGFYDGFRRRTRFARRPADRLTGAAVALWTRSKRMLMRFAAVRRLRERLRRG